MCGAKYVSVEVTKQYLIELAELMYKPLDEHKKLRKQKLKDAIVIEAVSDYAYHHGKDESEVTSDAN